MEMILHAIAKAIEEAKKDESKPTLIEVRTVIGYGSPNKSGKADSHGAPLGADEIKLTKEAYKWTFENDFHVPQEVYEHFRRSILETGEQKEKEWNDLFSNYKKEFPELGLATSNKQSIMNCLQTGQRISLPMKKEKVLPLVLHQVKF